MVTCNEYTYMYCPEIAYDSDWLGHLKGLVFTPPPSTNNRVLQLTGIYLYVLPRDSVIPSVWAVWRYWLLSHHPSTNTAHWSDRFVLKSIVIPTTTFTQNHFHILPLDAVLVMRVVRRRWLTTPQHGINLLEFQSHPFDLFVHPSASTPNGTNRNISCLVQIQSSPRSTSIYVGFTERSMCI